MVIEKLEYLAECITQDLIKFLMEDNFKEKKIKQESNFEEYMRNR